jgi:tetratricopeptide (TPR) repeat protein
MLSAMRASTCLLAVVILVAPAPSRADELDPLAQAIDQHPDDAKAYDAYAMAAFKAKRFDDAIRRLKVGVARIADYGEGYYKLAYAFRQKKEWADAADYYRRYIALNPQKTDPYFGLGASLQGLGDTKGALTAYDKYVSLEKSPTKQKFVDQARAELARLDPSRAPKAEAAPPATAPANPVFGVASAGPPRADAPQLRAAAEQLQKDGKLDEAAVAYTKALDADRGNLELYNALGNCYFAMKRYNEAASAFRQATDRDPGYALGWYNLAHALRKGDRKAEAVAAYRQYMRLRPDDPDPYYGLGMTLKALGDARGAIDALRRYINMEKRPDEQRWVDKARAELEALEAAQRGGPSGKLDDRRMPSRFSDEAIDRELARDAILPLTRDDLIDPFARPSRRLPGLRDPWQGATDDALLDPFDDMPRRSAGAAPPADRRQLREYGAALAEYRRALTRHVEDVASRYERGVALALMDDGPAAARAWNSVPLADPRVEAARRSVEHVRALVARR